MKSTDVTALIIVIMFILTAHCNKEGCLCKELNNMTSCHCEGEMDYLPRNLSNGNIHILSIAYGTFKNISADSLINYKESLTELTITRMHHLIHIDDGALDKMHFIKLLRIVHTYLRKLPKIQGLGKRKPLHIVDFESNMIESLESYNIEITVEQLFLDYNRISIIKDWAFKGSEIGKLSLRGNRYLKELAKDAFTGLKSLRDLDLSETSIHYLPTVGLEELEILRLTNTPSLKTIPSIYDLTKLQKAYLTYFFHCCAFHYPAKHDPVRHKKYMEAVEKFCSNNHLRLPRNAEDGFGAFSEDVDYIEIGTYNYTITKQNYSEGGDLWGNDDAIKSSDEMFHNQSAELPTARVFVSCGNITKRLK